MRARNQERIILSSPRLHRLAKSILEFYKRLKLRALNMYKIVRGQGGVGVGGIKM
jgi:peptide deformylase